MQITWINEENIDWFYGLLQKLWDRRTSRDIFVGALDGEGEAVAACAAEIKGMELVIRSFAVAPSRQREGIGRAFLGDVCEYAFSRGCSRIGSFWFQPEEDAWGAFLSDAGFADSHL